MVSAVMVTLPIWTIVDHGLTKRCIVWSTLWFLCIPIAFYFEAICLVLLVLLCLYNRIDTRERMVLHVAFKVYHGDSAAVLVGSEDDEEKSLAKGKSYKITDDGALEDGVTDALE